MSKNLLKSLALASVALMGTSVVTAQEQVALSFNRTGTDAASVTVTSNIDGISATLAEASPTFKATGGKVTNEIICPNVNGNANADITLKFSVTGLPANAAVSAMALDIHALNGAGEYQDHNDAKNRKWNVDVSMGGAAFGSLSDIDIAKDVNPSGMRHKMWDLASVSPFVVTASPVEFSIHVTSGSSNEGCFLGLSEIVLSYEAPASPAHTYMYFEANRKETSDNVWGTYLQDANEAISGSSVYNKTSTLCGSDDLTRNCVWEITEGTEDGAYHVQNFVTKKYLVNLVAYGSTTVDEPVNIWFHELTRGDKTGIQIGVSSTVNNNCLDQDNCDRLVGLWANDDGNLWFKTTMDATTPEEVDAFFFVEDPRVAEIQKKIDDTKALCERYVTNAPMAADAVNELMAAFEVFTPEYVIEEGYYDQLDDMIASMVVAPVEEAVLAALNANVVGNYWTLRGMRRVNMSAPGYLSSKIKENTSAGWPSFMPIAEPDSSTNWLLIPNGTEVQFIMQNVATSKYIGTPSVHYCKVVETEAEAGAFTFGVRDGYVLFNSVTHSGNGLSFDSSRNDPVEIYNSSDIGAIWAVTATPAPVTESHTYMYFEANRKETSDNVWGTYLQDANEAISGSSVYNKTSTLCGSDGLTRNCVWEITEGTEDGAYHVQNFVTKKYLVNLVAYGSTTVDEPVNIWFHELTRGDKTGIQIGVSSTVNNNCLDQDNCDRLVGLWANDDGNLWFPATMDAKTPEEVDAFFNGNGPSQDELVAAFSARIDEIIELGKLYLESVPFAGQEATVRIAALEIFKSNAASYVGDCTSAEEAIAAANREALEPIERALLADLNADKNSSAYVFFNVSKEGYLSTTLLDTNDDNYCNLATINAGTMWGFNDEGSLFGLNAGETMCVSKTTGLNGYCGPYNNFHRQTLKVSFGLSNGYVVLNTNVEGGAVGYGSNSYVQVIAATELGARWKVVQKLTTAEFAAAFGEQLTLWGSNVPGGAEIVKEGLAEVTGAADLATVSARGVELRNKLLATLAPSDKHVVLKNVGIEQYLGYEFGWFTQTEENEAAEFEIVADPEYSMPADLRYFLRNSSSGMYITIDPSTGKLSEVNTVEGNNVLNFIIRLHNNGYVMIRCGSYGLVGYMNYVLGSSDDGEIKMGSEKLIHNSPRYFWSVYYAGESGNDDAEKIAEINAKLDAIKALARKYAENVPFTSKEVANLIAMVDEMTGESLLEFYDNIDEYLAEQIVVPLEELVMNMLIDKSGKPWTLYQPGQGAYLGCEAKATNQGWNSFNYQAEANYTGYWTAVKVSDGVYVMKSANGKFIGTPKVHYCRVEESQEEAGEFAIVAKEGYVVFNSIAHPGNSLGLDGKNDPVEIMNSEDGSRGYLWQVDLYTGDLYETVSISEIEAIADDAVIYDLQGRRVKNVSTGLYIVNGVKTMIRK